jgi:integrase
MEATIASSVPRVPWNNDKLTGQKPPRKLREIWAIRIRLQLGARTRDLAMFNLAIDSKLRACDLTKLRVRDVCLGSRVAPRATVMQQKTQRPVQFEITEQTRESVEVWIKAAGLLPSDFLFPGRIHASPPAIDASVCAASASLDTVNWTRRYRVRHAHDASDQSIVDLSPDKKPQGRTAAAWS